MPRVIPEPRVCIFCEGTPLSKEHIYARWLHPYLPKSGEKNHSVLSMTLKNREGDEELSAKLRSGDGHEGSARVVCQTCNNEWMSRLQEQAKPFLLPMVQGNSVRLFAKQVKTLAAWATMFCIVHESAKRDARYIASTDDDRRFLMDTCSPPPGWKIWIGTHRNKFSGTLISHTAVKVIADDHNGAYDVPDGEPIIPNTASTTFFVGPVLFHCFRSHLPRVLRKQSVPNLDLIHPHQ